MEIRNNIGELLDISFDGVELSVASKIVIYNHGFGTDRHERGLTDDIVDFVDPEKNDICIARISYSGYGKSEGKQEDKTLDTMADDLTSLWQYIENHKGSKSKITNISFSMGNQVFVKALKKYPMKIDKMISVSPASFVTGEEGKAKWSQRPGVTFDKDIMNIPRADGSITKISQSFWDSLDPGVYKAGLAKAAQDFNSILIRGKEDDVVDNSSLVELPYKKIYEISGDHNFSGKNRNGFLTVISKAIDD